MKDQGGLPAFEEECKKMVSRKDAKTQGMGTVNGGSS